MTAITEFVNFERRGRVDVLTVNNPPNNVLSHGVRKGLKEGIVAASGDAAVSAIVDGDLTAAGVAFAEQVVNEQRPLRKSREREDKILFHRPRHTEQEAKLG